MSHASLLGNMGAPYVVIYRLIRRSPIHKYEIFGIIVSFLGCVISIFDKNVEKVNPEH